MLSNIKEVNTNPKTKGNFSKYKKYTVAKNSHLSFYFFQSLLGLFHSVIIDKA